MMPDNRGKSGFAVLALGMILMAQGIPSAAEGLRNITSVTGDVYFDGSWMVESQDVFLAQLVPTLKLLASVKRDDYPGGYAHQVSAGPLVNLTDFVYFSAVYGITFDSAAAISHEADLEITYENDTSSGAFAIRGDFFPANGNYYYVLPSFSASFHPLEPLGLFGKIFLSWDAAHAVTASFWGETSWSFQKKVAVRAGFTLGWANGFGYSIIAGVDWRIIPALALRYKLQYLSHTIEYLDTPLVKDGIENALVLDVTF
jgi:hypothetical protein